MMMRPPLTPAVSQNFIVNFRGSPVRWFDSLGPVIDNRPSLPGPKNRPVVATHGDPLVENHHTIAAHTTINTRALEYQLLLPFFLLASFAFSCFFFFFFFPHSSPQKQRKKGFPSEK
jgi:hypothetical protein